MILVDSSVWIDHFRTGNLALSAALQKNSVLTHPFVMGELACGNLKNRKLILADLSVLPCAVTATHEEVLQMIEERKLWGQGIRWIDGHLLSSALLSGCQLWSLDQRLDRAAASAGVKLHRNH